MAYGKGDASYQAAGGQEGIWRLVVDFYEAMSVRPDAKHIRQMHPEDLTESIDKLASFLCGWLGGPRLYQEKYGGISIPGVHLPFTIGPKERDAWLACMEEAITKQHYAEDFKEYLYMQLCVPAERIVTLNQRQRSHHAE